MSSSPDSARYGDIPSSSIENNAGELSSAPTTPLPESKETLYDMITPPGSTTQPKTPPAPRAGLIRNLDVYSRDISKSPTESRMERRIREEQVDNTDRDNDIVSMDEDTVREDSMDEDSTDDDCVDMESKVSASATLRGKERYKKVHALRFHTQQNHAESLRNTGEVEMDEDGTSNCEFCVMVARGKAASEVDENTSRRLALLRNGVKHDPYLTRHLDERLR